MASLLPQTDMALALTRLRWIAYLRGTCPGRTGALRDHAWRMLERLALRRAAQLRVTTPMLATEVGLPRLRLVPPGIRPVPRG